MEKVTFRPYTPADEKALMARFRTVRVAAHSNLGSAGSGYALVGFDIELDEGLSISKGSMLTLHIKRDGESNTWIGEALITPMSDLDHGDLVHLVLEESGIYGKATPA